MDHRIMGTMATTKLGLVVHFGQIMFLDMRGVPVLVFQETGLRSILEGQVRSTDSHPVEAFIQANSRANSSVRGVMVHPMIEDLGRLIQRKVGHLENIILVKEDRGKSYLALAAQAEGGVR